MKVILGLNDYKLNKHREKENVFWDLERSVNAHMVLIGKSGTGKSFTLLKIIEQLRDCDVRIHVFDVHGDMISASMSSVEFSESTRYGINPLAIYAHPSYGGVRKRIQAFISTIKSVVTVGERQEAVIRNLLTDP